MVERNTITEITETNVKSEEESGNDDEAEYISKVEIENKDKMPKELGTVSEGKHTEERDHSDDESNDDHGLGKNIFVNQKQSCNFYLNHFKE